MRAFSVALTLIGLVGLTVNDAEARGRRCRGFAAPAMVYAPAPVYPARPAYSMPPATYAPAMKGQPAYGAAPRYAAPAYGRAAQPQARLPQAATTVDVVAYDNRFEPQTINIAPGTTVRWTNRGSHAHTATANDGSWDSGDIAPGTSYSATFQRPGTYYYYCRHHQQDRMQGTITVGQSGAPPAGRAGGSRSPGY